MIAMSDLGCFFFFFKQKTAYEILRSDWSSDVCSSDLVDPMKDAWHSALWIMEADGSRQRFLVDGSSARWSPDGTRILFIASVDNGKPQIFVRWMDDEGAVSQVTRVDVSPSTPTWSPDGEHIAFVAIVPAESPWNIGMPSPPEGADWTPPPRILDRLHYRQ